MYKELIRLLYLDLAVSKIAFYLENFQDHSNKYEKNDDKNNVDAHLIAFSILIENTLQVTCTFLQATPCLLRFIVNFLD